MQPVPYGCCQCGCGEKTKVAPQTHCTLGWVRGEPMRYVNGHNRRLSAAQYEERDCGYNTPCWMWLRGLTSAGYGQIYVEGRPMLAHRVFYEREHGPVPTGLVLDHLCNNRGCVNPVHLEPTTNAKNVRRGKAKVTEDDVRAIRASQEPRPVLAARYGISPSTITGIRCRQRWKEVL